MSLLSLEFFALALAAILWVRLTRGPFRGLGFAILSLTYIESYVGITGLLVVAGFSLGGYAAALALRRSRVAGSIAIVLLTVAFIHVQTYSFLGMVLPSGWIVPALHTVGLSFLFFKVIHVAIDYGGGTIEALPLGEYLVYCFNFTAYLAGPIQRFQEFDEQWRGTREPLAAEFEPHLDATLRILRGLAKKYVLATYLAPWALLPGATVGTASIPHIVAGVYLFYVYLYLDFSGYCDVVIGTGALLGVRPPENFDFPFLAPNVAQFWLRVHRTLTTWLTDYVFNPVLAGLLRAQTRGRSTLLAVSIAMMTTMLVSGLWHGTTANFVLFGLAHGVLLTCFRIYEHAMKARLGRKRFAALRRNPFYRAGATALTFATTGFAYVFFVFDLTQLEILWSRVTGMGA